MDFIEEKLKKYLINRRLNYSFEMKIVFNSILMKKSTFSVDDLYKIIDSGDVKISKATIYRHIGIFENAGIIKSVPNNLGKKVYECIDSSTHTGYLLCTSCGKTIDISDHRISAAASIFSERHRFEIESVNIIIKGLCNRCQKE
ncbi:MAG: transcriptional repressor [Spirochaetales bacterium]|nr:transcriptional repressor [Spirochaetales bacterium]